MLGKAHGEQAENTPQRTATLDTVIEIAPGVGVTPGEIALAWVSAEDSIPIVGPRTVDQLNSNLGAMQVSLTRAQIDRLDVVSAPAPIYPYTVLDDARVNAMVTDGDHDRIYAPAAQIA